MTTETPPPAAQPGGVGSETKGEVSRSQPVFGSVPLPIREAEPSALERLRHRFVLSHKLRLMPRKGWKRRLVFAALKLTDDHVWHEAWYGSLSACVVGYVRDASKRVLGGNCAFADDDLALLEHLAMRAVDAGLVGGLHPSLAEKALALSAERRAGDARNTTDPEQSASGGSDAAPE